MSNEKQETIADIVAEMRIELNQSWHDIDREKVHDFPDRIESAAKCEREATREKPSQVGNVAKMREAFENIAEYAKTAALHTDDLHLLGYLNQIERWSESVLSSPPRNCDVGTAEEQNRRFCKWCRKYGIDGDMEVACAHQDMSCTLCALRLAQMPYEEG